MRQRIESMDPEERQGAMMRGVRAKILERHPDYDARTLDVAAATAVEIPLDGIMFGLPSQKAMYRADVKQYIRAGLEMTDDLPADRAAISATK